MLRKQCLRQHFLPSVLGGRKLSGDNVWWKVVLARKPRGGCDSTCVTGVGPGAVPGEFVAVVTAPAERGPVLLGCHVWLRRDPE